MPKLTSIESYLPVKFSAYKDFIFMYHSDWGLSQQLETINHIYSGKLNKMVSTFYVHIAKVFYFQDQQIGLFYTNFPGGKN